MNGIRLGPQLIWLLLVAVLLTGITSAAITQIQATYLQRFPLYYDSVSYQFNNARLSVRVAREGRLSVAADEWLHNARSPLRTAPVVLLAPGMLTLPVGHMATVIPVLLAFLGLLGWTVYRRTDSPLYAIGAMGLFCGIPGVFFTTSGLGAFWLDQPAALLAASAVLCLLNSAQGRDLRWLAGFACFAALTALSRYVAAVYLFVVCAPLLAVFLAARGVRERGIVRPVLVPILVIAAVVGALAGYFLVAHFARNSYFYSNYGYALNGGVRASWVFVEYYLTNLLSGAVGLLLLSTLLIYIVQHRGELRARLGELLASLWIAGGLLAYIVVVQQVTLAVHPLWYLLPLLLIAAVTPFTISRPNQQGRRTLDLMGTLMLGAGVALGVQTYNQQLLFASQPSEAVQQYKYLDIELGKALDAIGQPVVWNTYFDEYTPIPTMEAFYRSGKLHLPAGQVFFNAHETAWRADYPGLSAEQISQLVYAATRRYVDVAVVFSDPATAMSAPQLDNDVSRAVAQHMASSIRDDAGWTLVRTFDETPFGGLAVYKNSASNGAAYEAVLRDDGSVRP